MQVVGSDHKRMIDIDELCQRYGFAKHTVRGWCSQRLIPHVKIGRSVLYDTADLWAWIEAKKVDSCAGAPE